MIEQLICELSTAARELVSGSRRTPSSATDGLRSKNPGAAASRRQKSSVFSTACATASTVAWRSRVPVRTPQRGRALLDHALGRSLCYWRRFWSRERHRRERADVLEPPKNGFLARRPQSSCSARWSETRWTRCSPLGCSRDAEGRN